MSKAYHATQVENKELIEAHGIYAMATDKMTHSDDQILSQGVFFFCSIDDARDFGVDCCGGEYAIFSAEVDEFVLDPEYDGEAIFAERSFSAEEVEFVESNI